MKSIGIIPARYAATRFPGKLLVDIQGRSMLQRVYEQALKSTLLDQVLIATDDQRIFDHAKSFDALVKMTRADHPNGTSRIGELMPQLEDYDLIINIQGDEPFIDPSQLDSLISQFSQSQAEIATMAIRINDPAILFDPNTVKVVFNEHQEALYFSRNPIPYLKGYAEEEWLKHAHFYKHVGLYAFKKESFKSLLELPIGHLAKAESLEQLTWLENNYAIAVVLTDKDSIGIDTPEDLEWALANLEVS